MEAYARARHPQHGTLLPGAFMADASEASVAKLSELALTDALKTGVMFSKHGVNISLTVNIHPAILDKLPIADIVKTHRPGADQWPGLIVGLREEHIISDLRWQSSWASGWRRTICGSPSTNSAAAIRPWRGSAKCPLSSSSSTANSSPTAGPTRSICRFSSR